MKQKSLIRENMPQFGADHIVDSSMSGKVWKDPKTGFRHFPAISVNPSYWPAVPVRINPNTPVVIFSNGSEAGDWHNHNCEWCNRIFCSLRDRMQIAWAEDGKIPFKAAKRIGCKLTIQPNGVFAQLDKDCREYLSFAKRKNQLIK